MDLVGYFFRTIYMCAYCRPYDDALDDEEDA
jgi:hypothetical protein